MDRQSTVKDLLELRTGARADGYLIHQGCGHRICWSLMADGAVCVGCGIRWNYAWLLDRDRGGYHDHWTPPVEVHGEELKR